MKNSSSIILHLSLIEGIGPSFFARCINGLDKKDLSQLYDMSISDVKNIFGFNDEKSQKLIMGLADMSRLEKELMLIERHSISWATVADTEYPELLKQIHLPPLVCYWSGNLSATANSIAVIGSRDADSYAQEVIDQLIPELVMHDWVIVSGGARGADTMAHTATLAAGGTTIAVLGSGLLRPYPPENKQLFEKIIQSNGAVLSPFALQAEPLPIHFPARNRVIAGMSRGCIVVQAAVKSGARITADFCLTQGKEVFAIPGHINNILSAGCHALIQQGAKLTTSIADILVEFGQDVQEQQMHMYTPAIKQSSSIKPIRDFQELPIKEKIRTICKSPSSVDELIEQTNIPLIELTKILFDMQLEGAISQNMTGLWQKHS